MHTVKITKGLVLLMIFPLVFLGCENEKDLQETDNLKLTIDSLSTALEREKTKTDSLQELSKSMDTIAGGYPIFYGKKYEGIENPKEFIKNQLQNQPEKIPMSPVLGGKMEFRKIDIISEKWLLAIYDDGHVQGKAIMEYQLKPDGSVAYTIVATQE